MADETKRVIDQTTDSSLSAGDFVIVDSQSEGTRKFDLGTELTDIKQDLAELEGGGLSDSAKQALLTCFQNVYWRNGDGQEYCDALQEALYPVEPPATLSYITCVYTQSGAVYDTDSLNSLKANLVVTGHYSDDTTQTITGYTLSGTLTEGTSTITVTYNGKTTTFDVTVSISLDSIAYGSLTYRDIFVTNNVVPLGDFEEDLNLSTSFQYYHDDQTKRYKINAGSPSQSADNCVSPTKSLKCFGSTSAQIQYLDSATMSGTYLACISVNISRYSAGKSGINVYFTQGVVAIDLTENKVTDGWQYMVGTGSVSGSNPTLSIYIGSMSSANLDTYIDDVVVTPLPSGLSEADALTLYKKYLQIRGATV